MKENNQNEERIDKIFESITGIQRASAGPYFFTRLQQKLTTTGSSVWEVIGSWISKPSIAFSALSLVIILNIAVLTNKSGKPDRYEDANEEYTIASAAIYDYSNPESE